MQPYQVIENKGFIGREYERDKLIEIAQHERAEIIVVYGRRRVGKTELLEQTYRERNLLKFEGLEGEPQAVQIQQVLRTLARYTGEAFLANLNFTSWVEMLELIAKYVEKGVWTLYFEELQWLANYETSFISALKYVWDNFLRRNPQLKVILCGSSPSFMVAKVLHSKALYNRSIHEIPLKPLTIYETQKFLAKHSVRSVMDTYLTLGGIPEYLTQIEKESSLFLGICKHSFTQGGYFANESERIFVSSLSRNKHYRTIIEFLSKRRFATRAEIAKHLQIKSGGQLSEILNDLSICGFVEKYTPYNQKSDSMLVRYCIYDYYLHFYYKFIEPLSENIENGNYNDAPNNALNTSSYFPWLGYAFERFCRSNSMLIAKILGFSGIQYKSGVFFNRKAEEQLSGYQIDLIFERNDKVITVCEIRYLQNKVDTTIIAEFEAKLALLPIKKNYSLQKILITTEGATDALISRAYFDRIITLEDLFKEKHWS